MKRIVLAAILAAFALSGCEKKEAATAAAVAPPQAYKGATVLTLSPTTLRDDREVVGTVRATETVTLSSKLMGTILSMPVRVGMRVGPGQLIARIDAKDIEAQVAKVEGALKEADEGLSELDSADLSAQSAIRAAEANRDLAKTTLERFKTLLERGSVSRQEYDEVVAKYKGAEAETDRAKESRNGIAAKRRQILAKKEQARADIESIKANLAYRTLVSPISGVIIAKPAEEGMLAAPGAPLVVIEEEGRARLEANVEESMLSGIRLGDPVTVVIESLGNMVKKGHVNEISPVADQASRTLIVKISIDDQKGLKTGFFGRAIFEGPQRQALLIPQSAIIEKGQLNGVFVVDAGNVARLTLIKTGKIHPEGVEVLSGLSEGGKIVANPGANLSDGMVLE